MPNIYQALENAGNERTQASVQGAAAAVSSGLPKGVEDKLLALLNRVESLLDRADGRIVEFTGAQPGNDSSKLVFEFARLAAIRQRKNVLLIATGPFPYVGQHASGRRAQSLEDVLEGDVALDDVMYPVEGTSMCISQLSTSDLSLQSVLASPNLNDLIQTLRQQFDLILVDSLPVVSSSSTALLSSIVDGVVIVVEAEKTRWQSVKYGMNQIGAQHGKVLGIVLNKQRHYIPNFIYRKL